MRQDIRLFIGGKEIEFNSNPKILFNYKVTDVNNPTVVKNSYTKTIEVEGTPKNNDAFENIWNLERVQFAGIDFNPIKKTDFVIYVNGEIYEKGYAKLDGITTKNNKCTYSITLFGGLGSFFYNLSYKDSEGDDKKKLSDLSFAKRDIGTVFTDYDPDLNFRINKETLWDAWNTITGNPDAVYDESEVNRPNNYLYEDKWNILNFAPAYNGVPEDFEASKCIINKKNMVALQFSKTEDGTTYTDYFGYITGEQPNDELTEWETFDLRSYLQRPVVSMRRVIDACCNPINNGGYEVHLDDKFFSYDNPYYSDAWMTLPMLRENIEGGETYKTTTGTITLKSGAVAGESQEMLHYNVNYNTATISEVTNVNLGLMLDLEVDTDYLSNSQLYMYKQFSATPSKKGETQRVSSFESISSVSVQLVAYDALDKVTASSNVFFITDKLAANKATFEYNSLWYLSDVPVPAVTYVYGSFKKSGDNRYRLTGGDGNPIVLGFSFDTVNPFKRLELKVLPVTYDCIYYKSPYKWWKGDDYNGIHKTEYFGKPLSLYTQNYEYYSGDIGIDAALERGMYNAEPKLSIADFQVISKDYSELFSNTYVKKENILSTEKTPADYLISYAKMFGLYFYSDPAEVADDPDLAPNGVIHLMTRDTYYTDEVVDLQEIIDRNKGLKITPATPDSKWFNFNVEQAESEANKEHKDKYGYDYGYKKINTGYNFNTDNKALLDKVSFKGGVEVLETSKYYQRPTQGYPAYGLNGFLYTLYEYADGEMNTLEVDDQFGKIDRYSINSNGWDDTDAFKKPQFHEADNKGTDGKDVLLFYTGEDFYTSAGFTYWLTDDIAEMIELNDGKPCWIMTADEKDVNGKRIAYKINTLPIFQRNIVYGANGTIKHSWDFGNPFLTFVRDTYVGEQSSIYAKCWDDYIADMYSENNRKLNTYVVFKDRPNAGMLRKFYWFDNCLWRMNAIKDWDIAELEPTAVEFVKVIDPQNYKLTPITNTIIASFTFPNLTNVDDEFDDGYGNLYEHYYRITATAQDVTGVINVGNAGSWVFGDGVGGECSVTWTDGTSQYYAYRDIITPSEDYGNGDAIRVFHLTANTKNMERTWRFSIVDNDDRWYTVNIIQAANSTVDTPTFTLNPSSIYFEAGGGQQTVLLENSNIDSYTVGNRPTWISLLNVKDVGFTLQAYSNTAGAIKNAAISVTGHKTGYSDITKYIQISQNIYSGSITFDKSVIYVGKNKGDVSENVKITWTNIGNRTFAVNPSNHFRFHFVNGVEEFYIEALEANTLGNNVITGTFTITATDTNGNTIKKSITIVQTP